VIAASKKYMRVLVRVPEAYLLVRTLKATRPGLLILDADGRRVDSIPFPGMGAPPIDAATIAKRLVAAQTTKVVELWRIQLKGDAEALKRVRKMIARNPGVRFSGNRSAPRNLEPLKLEVDKGALNPEQLAAIAEESSVSVTWQEPVPIQIDPKTKATVAGAWHVDSNQNRAYVTALLLHPRQLPKGWGTDLESRTYRLPNIPKGGAGCRVALAPVASPGVVAIFADIFKERQIVVGRKKTVDWKAVMQTFADAGCKATEARNK
jgi:hypothetical protein